jgi:hypothetical protein
VTGPAQAVGGTAPASLHGNSGHLPAKSRDRRVRDSQVTCAVLDVAQPTHGRKGGTDENIAPLAVVQFERPHPAPLGYELGRGSLDPEEPPSRSARTESTPTFEFRSPVQCDWQADEPHMASFGHGAASGSSPCRRCHRFRPPPRLRS